jgi:hypothetical protein
MDATQFTREVKQAMFVELSVALATWKLTQDEQAALRNGGLWDLTPPARQTRTVFAVPLLSLERVLAARKQVQLGWERYLVNRPGGA